MRQIYTLQKMFVIPVDRLLELVNACAGAVKLLPSSTGVHLPLSLFFGHLVDLPIIRDTLPPPSSVVPNQICGFISGNKAFLTQEKSAQNNTVNERPQNIENNLTSEQCSTRAAQAIV